MDLRLQRRDSLGSRFVIQDFLLFENVLAEVDALITDIDTRTGDHLANLRWLLAAKGTGHGTPSLRRADRLGARHFPPSLTRRPTPALYPTAVSSHCSDFAMCRAGSGCMAARSGGVS